MSTRDRQMRRRFATFPLMLVAILAMVANPVAALPPNTHAALQPSGFQHEIVGLTVTCDTTVSFESIVSNTLGYTDVTAFVEITLWVDQATFEANAGGAVYRERFPAFPGSLPLGSTAFSDRLFEGVDPPVFFGTDTFFVRIESVVNGYPPQEGALFVNIAELWTASVSGCSDEPIDPEEPTLVEQLIAVLIRILQDLLNG